ncbi:MAG: Hsp20/alpha crystallin family protein [Usitatibacter sp.]
METKQRELEKRATTELQAAPLVPPVDIIEDVEGITVRADLPGASKETLSIGVEGENLTIEATVNLGESAKMQPVYAEIRVAQYKRTFVLGRDLDTGKIDAQIRNGVLTIRVPKLEQAKPRRIAVKAE